MINQRMRPDLVGGQPFGLEGVERIPYPQVYRMRSGLVFVVLKFEIGRDKSFYIKLSIWI